MIVDGAAAVRFLRTAFEPEDWIAIFLKSYQTGRTAQRVGPVAMFLEPRLHAWLRAMNAQRFNVYVSVNAIRSGVRARTKSAIGAIRHLFLEADHDGADVLARLASSADIPTPSYVLESSPNRVHVFWRVASFTNEAVERLQKHLAAEFGTDIAATACSQTTRLPGFRNHKHDPSHLVTIEYRDCGIRHGPDAFPLPPRSARPFPSPRLTAVAQPLDVVQRARRYLARIEPAIAGQHGDVHTFRVCCRITRGFALSDQDALAVLRDWNDRCEPPWTERELRDKLLRARKYGDEPFGGLIRQIR
jgi:DNA primase RepB-like protein